LISTKSVRAALFAHLNEGKCFGWNHKEKIMAAVPISKPEGASHAVDLAGELLSPIAPDRRKPDWTHFVAAGTIVAGAAIIASGRRRTGMTVAALGTAMALVEEQDSVKLWWKRLPGLLDQAQYFLDRAEVYLKEATEKGHRLQGILRR